MIEKLNSMVEARSAARFMPKTHVPFQYYDCGTFALDMYQELGILPQGTVFPRYSVYSRGPKMLNLINDWVTSSKAFHQVDEPAPGDLLVSSLGLRGHHMGVYLGKDQVAHCCKHRNVTIENYSTGIFGPYINKIWRPNGLE